MLAARSWPAGLWDRSRQFPRLNVPDTDLVGDDAEPVLDAQARGDPVLALREFVGHRHATIGRVWVDGAYGGALGRGLVHADTHFGTLGPRRARVVVGRVGTTAVPLFECAPLAFWRGV